MKFRVSPTVLAFSVFAGGTCGLPRADDSPSNTMEDVTACSADAMRLCRDKMPDIEKIETCMKANYESLRPKCKSRFKDR